MRAVAGNDGLARARDALRTARVTPGGLFDVGRWTATWDTALVSLWEAHQAGESGGGGRGGGGGKFHVVVAGG